MDTIEKALKDAGIDKLIAPEPGGSYTSVNIRGQIAYIAIQFPILEQRQLYKGRIGQELTTEEGRDAARLCAENILAQIHKHIGFEKIEGLNHLDILYQSSEDWDEGPLVANGASDLFNQVLGSAGTHSRSISGVHKLPRNFSVGIVSTFTLLEKF